ncbi:Ubiquitin-like modifier HUB1 [Erysiphe necator]|uniref:Ubiquitin-like modifier HUB1 n=1 Tax=Uncinula necator TaxID=52586 RepID=A0A0B1P364_UNCNE|nr:Ubiquitin-like modifier HUB1 [Erysiphe necator]KHJ31119.1 putative ubiquitin-like protein [Erysiphe necator]
MTTDTEPNSHSTHADKEENRRDLKHRRSRSPSNEKRPRRNHNVSHGFRWKDKQQNERRDYIDTSESNRKRLERGYRDRSQTRRSRDSEIQTSKSAVGGIEDKYNVANKFGPSSTSTRGGSRRKQDNYEKEDESPSGQSLNSTAKALATTTTANDTEPMIVVYVNDRLGTRAAIPCLASDSILLFKAQVAARIGRQPHEIMLKRQGERPFKNQLTLEDYGVSNGVQLDLEVDTGD